MLLNDNILGMLGIYIHIYIITLHAFLFVNILKYKLNDEAFKI